MGAITHVIVVFIAFFAALYLFHEDEESSVGRSAVAALVIALLTGFMQIGIAGYIIAIVGSFLVLSKIQRYSTANSILVLVCGEILSMIIQLGIRIVF